jgi:hypothetical protein
MPSGSAAASLTSSVTIASKLGSAAPVSSVSTRSAAPGCARSTAAARYRQNRAGSLSSRSSESQATGEPGCLAQAASSVVLPNPAGVETTTSRRTIPSSKAAIRRALGTNDAET